MLSIILLLVLGYLACGYTLNQITHIIYVSNWRINDYHDYNFCRFLTFALWPIASVVWVFVILSKSELDLFDAPSNFIINKLEQRKCIKQTRKQD